MNHLQIIGQIIIGLGILLSLQGEHVFAQCNGSNNICDKKYNEVAFLTTHNAFNSAEDDFTFPNHNFNIASQLNAGVRGLMIDVYDEEGVLTVYHSFTALGTAPFSDFLQDIKTFLEGNPNEIVTIILECYTTASAIEADLNAVGLSDFLFTFDETVSWPTLQTMIDENKRLVLFSDVNDATPTQSWYHYIWNYAVETHFSNNSLEDFSCDFNRGEPDNDLFILNHFITNNLGVGLESEAAMANANPFFIDRVLQCQEETTKFPNFVTVDFYELGNGFEVVEALNQQIISSINAIDKEKAALAIYPNPVQNILTISAPDLKESEIELYDSQGQNLTSQIRFTQLNNTHWEIDCSNLESGLYLLKIANETKVFYH